MSTGAPFSVIREILVYVLGEEVYSNVVQEAKRIRTVRMAEKAHAAFRAMSPEEKAAHFARMKKGSLLEKALAAALVQAGFQGVQLNVWQAVPLGDRKVPREADIKIPLGDGRKVVVLCDGEAFHGPRFVFGDPQKRIEEDEATARAYFSLGYSVLRYSESEIKRGDAETHLLLAMEKLQRCQRILRLWHPPLEEVVA